MRRTVPPGGTAPGRWGRVIVRASSPAIPSSRATPVGTMRARPIDGAPSGGANELEPSGERLRSSGRTGDDPRRSVADDCEPDDSEPDDSAVRSRTDCALGRKVPAPVIRWRRRDAASATPPTGSASSRSPRPVERSSARVCAGLLAVGFSGATSGRRVVSRDPLGRSGGSARFALPTAGGSTGSEPTGGDVASVGRLIGERSWSGDRGPEKRSDDAASRRHQGRRSPAAPGAIGPDLVPPVAPLSPSVGISPFSSPCSRRNDRSASRRSGRRPALEARTDRDDEEPGRASARRVGIADEPGVDGGEVRAGAGERPVDDAVDGAAGDDPGCALAGPAMVAG